MGMDNFIINCKAQGYDNLESLLSVAFSMEGSRGKASHYMEKDIAVPYGSAKQKLVRTLIFLRHKVEGSHKLPVKTDARMAAGMVSQWLREVDTGYWDDEANGMDGSTGAAFRVFCDSRGRIDETDYVIVGIQPIFAWYHK